MKTENTIQDVTIWDYNVWVCREGIDCLLSKSKPNFTAYTWYICTII